MAHIYPFRGQWPVIDKDAFVADTATIIGNVTIKKDANIWPGAVLRGDYDKIIIGEGVNIQDNSVVHVEAGSPLIIEDYSMIGHNSIVHCSHIGSGTLIGMGSILLSHSRIGSRCLIGGGTLVTQHKVIPHGSMVYGNPFQIVRPLRQDEMDSIYHDVLEYRDLGREYKKMQELRNENDK